MPRRKISIEDALRVLEEGGIPLQVKPVAEQPAVTLSDRAKAKQPASPVSSKLIKITLFARHSVGSGGRMVQTDDEKHVESAGVESYGPGICVVPVALASHLLHADRAARDADAKMLEREQRSYVVVQRRGPDGYLHNVGVQVSNEILDSGLDSLPREFTHFV